MNEYTNLALLMHVIFFSGVGNVNQSKYDMGWLYIIICILFICAHIAFLGYEVFMVLWRKVLIKIYRKEMIAEIIAKKKQELEVIAEDEFESNHSVKDQKEVDRCEKVSESDWKSQFGDS